MWLVMGDSAAAQTSETALCDFVKKIIAARPTGFAAFKGKVKDKDSVVSNLFMGTLTPSSDSTCDLYFRSKVTERISTTKYICNLGPLRNFTDAKRFYDQAGSDLRACFPRAAFEESKDGDPANSGKSWNWYLETKQPGYTLDLSMSNFESLLSRVTPPQVRVQLEVTDTSSDENPRRGESADRGLGAGILTKADWQYLKSNGFKEDSHGLVVTTAKECMYLHTLINDPNTSSKKKLDAVNEYLFKMSFDKTISAAQGQSSPPSRGPCNN